MYVDNIEEYEKQDIVTKIEFEAISPSIKNYFFHHCVVYFVNTPYLIGKKYQTNGTVRDKIYKGKLLFPIKDLVSFVADCQ